MREFAVEPLRPLEVRLPRDLGRLRPALGRLAAAQGGWPPHPLDRVVRAEPTPADGDAADALEAGAAEADRLVDGGADLVVLGGGGPPVAALVVLATLLGLEPVTTVGTTGGPTWAATVAAVRDGVRSARPHRAIPSEVLIAAGAAEVAHGAGLLAQLAVRRTPALLSGAPDALAAALVAERVASGTGSWLIAGCTPASDAAGRVVAELQLEPLLDLELDSPTAADLALAVLTRAVGMCGAAPA